MAQFNLNDYETVEVRLKRAHDAHPDLRVITINHTTPADRSVSTWVVEARIYLNFDDQLENCPKATGWAFEVDGQNGMANKTSALENCETSAIGRALANMNLSGNKRTSREEMAKVERGVTPTKVAKSVDWSERIVALTDVDSARRLYMEAQKAKADKSVLDEITAKVATFGPTN
jgi:hypothetical protein